MGDLLRHKKTGGLYEVLFRGAVIHSDVPLYDYAPVTVCRRLSDDQIVARYGATPRDSFDVLHHSRLQTGRLLYEGDEVVVYRALGSGPVWVRPTSEMDDGRFDPAASPQADPSSEIEGLVERLTDAAIRLGRDQIHGDPDTEAGSRALFHVARTALLSRIRSTPLAGQDGSFAAYAPGDPVQKHTGDYQIGGIVRGAILTGAGQWRYVVEHRAEGGGSFLHIYAAANLCPLSVVTPEA